MVFIYSVSRCAKVKEYLKLHRHSPVFLVMGHNKLNIEAKFCQNNMYNKVPTLLKNQNISI